MIEGDQDIRNIRNERYSESNPDADGNISCVCTKHPDEF
jgi:hypothetical protein